MARSGWAAVDPAGLARGMHRGTHHTCCHMQPRRAHQRAARRACSSYAAARAACGSGSGSSREWHCQQRSTPTPGTPPWTMVGAPPVAHYGGQGWLGGLPPCLSDQGGHPTMVEALQPSRPGPPWHGCGLRSGLCLCPRSPLSLAHRRPRGLHWLVAPLATLCSGRSELRHGWA